MVAFVNFFGPAITIASHLFVVMVVLRIIIYECWYPPFLYKRTKRLKKRRNLSTRHILSKIVYDFTISFFSSILVTVSLDVLSKTFNLK